MAKPKLKPPPSLLFRFHRGGLEESMKTVVEVNIQELSKIIEVDEKDVQCNPYGYDDRIDWDTYIITANGSVYGFTNGDIKQDTSI